MTDEVSNDTIFATDAISIPNEQIPPTPINPVDVLLSKADSTKTDTNKTTSKEPEIKDIINYDAVDSILFDVAQQQATLFGRGHVDYGDLEVDAPTIIIDFKNSILKASADLDSNGKVLEYPLLKQGEDEFQAKEIHFNWQTDRGYIEDVYMQEGDGYVHTNQAYLDEDKNVFVENARYTTCNLAKPHYHFKMQKAKMIPDNKIVARGVNLYIDDIPTPLGLPFGLFPTSNVKKSGIIIPTDYGGSGTYGPYLNNFGYYWAISDKIATKFLGEVHARGTYGLKTTTQYNVRYKYSGSFTANYRKVTTNNDEYGIEEANTYKLTWNHKPISRNGKSLTANVNFQDGSFNKFNILEQENITIPNINSSINLSFPLGKLPFKSTVSFKHDQKQTSLTTDEGEEETAAKNTFNLPNFTLAYTGERNPYKNLPYTKATPSKLRKNILEQFSISYSASGNNHTSTEAITDFTAPDYYDLITNPDDTTDLTLSNNFKELLERNRFYMTHKATLANNLKLKAFTLSPSFNYTENWYFNQSLYGVDVPNNTVTLAENPGFYRIGRYSFSTSLSTTFYNFYTLGNAKTKKIDGIEKTVDRQLKIRQTISPRISFSASPDYSESEDVYQYLNYNSYEDSTLANSTLDTLEYQKYLLYNGSPSTSGIQRRLNFSLNNTFEMKLPTKWTQKDGDKNEPISLLNLNASTSYNFAADSIKLSNISLSANNSKLFNGLASITASAQFDPYQYDSITTTVNGVESSTYSKVDNYWAADNGFFARLYKVNISTSLNLNPNSFKKATPKNRNGTNPDIKKPNDTPNGEKPKEKKSLYSDFSLPWTLRLSHNYAITHNTPNSDTTKTHTLGIQGSLKLSENWSSNFKINYDIANKEFTYPSLTLNRDLHCWQMGFTWIPFGISRRYNFTIGVKASMLKDLKYEKQNGTF